MSCFNQVFGNPTLTGTRTRFLDVSGFFDCIAFDPCCNCVIPPCFTDFAPFIAGDEFVYNFNFEVTTVKLMSVETGVELADVSGTWKTGNKQITFKADDTAGNDCFFVKVNEDCCFCFAFQKELCPENTMLIESFYGLGERDCGGNTYDGVYSNRMRIVGSLKAERVESNPETNEDDEVISRKVTEVYELNFQRFWGHESFLRKHLTLNILQGENPTITLLDGTVHEFDDFTGNIESETEAFNKNWISIIELKKEPCERYKSC